MITVFGYHFGNMQKLFQSWQNPFALLNKEIAEQTLFQLLVTETHCIYYQLQTYVSCTAFSNGQHGLEKMMSALQKLIPSKNCKNKRRAI
jgi:hypothetical protein